MPNQKKKRTTKTSPNTAGPTRRAKQEAAAKANKLASITPWRKAKGLRQIKRQAAGKTYTNWLKKQSAASNYKSSGPNVVKG